MLLDKKQIMSYLPHREPFLFIDSVESIEGEAMTAIKEIEGRKVVCHFFVDPEHIIFKGHFPGDPVLPGVVQIEMMGQASCFGVYHYFKGKGLIVKLLGVQQAKFRKPVVPGMNLRIEAVCLQTRGSALNYDCRIYEGDQIVSEAMILASVNV